MTGEGDESQGVALLEASEVDVVAALLARAFIDTTSYVAIYPEPEGREARLRRLLAANLRLHLQLDGASVRVLREGGKIAATARYGDEVAPLRVPEPTQQRVIQLQRRFKTRKP